MGLVFSSLADKSFTEKFGADGSKGSDLNDTVWGDETARQLRDAGFKSASSFSRAPSLWTVCFSIPPKFHPGSTLR